MNNTPNIRHIQKDNYHGYVITAFDKNSNMEVYFQVYEQSDDEGKNSLAYSSEYGDEQSAIAALQNWKKTGQYRPFESWMRDVNRAIQKLSNGLVGHTDDLPDYSYRECYNAGETAQDAAEQALDWAGEF